MSEEIEKNKLSRKQMLKLKEIDDKIDELFEMKSKIIGRILENKGDSIGVTKMEPAEGEKPLDKPWLRVTLIDNLMPFSEKDVIYRVARFSRYEAKIECLVHEPKVKINEEEEKPKTKKK